LYIEKCQKIGGFEGLLKYHTHLIERQNQKPEETHKIGWNHELFRESAMGSWDIDTIVSFWQDQGLVLYEEKDGKKQWKDLCVVDFFGGPTLPCEWLSHTLYENFSNPSRTLSKVWLTAKSDSKEPIIQFKYWEDPRFRK